MTQSVNNPPGINPIHVLTPDAGGTGFSNPLGSSLAFNGGNVIVNPPIYLAKFNSTTQNLPINGNYQLNFDTTLYQSNWPTSDDPGVFFVPLPGFYFVCMQIFFAPGPSGGYRQFFVNSSVEFQTDFDCLLQYPIGNSPLLASTSGLVYFPNGLDSSQYSFIAFAGQIDTAPLDIGTNSASLTAQSTQIYICYLGGN